MPTNEEMDRNILEVYDKYKIPNVIAGIDGCHFSFREKPRLANYTSITLWESVYFTQGGSR